ncbi:MAG: histidinol dehydrogenase [Alphaproteobacteria bacterium]|nr:histidinol dehydrogenase [Alphaproteobacteria bacterium]
MPLRLSTEDADFEQRFQALLNSKRELEEDVDAIVRDILADVSERGDAAVVDYTAKFDRFDASETLRIDQTEIETAAAQCAPETLDALRLAAERIRAYHARQMPEGFDFTDAAGVRLGSRWTAIDAVGVYVPGGLASYPSSVLMNVIPAKVAGVPRVVMTVPTPDGEINPLVLAAAQLAGVDEVYRIGGAQAVGALAYGCESIAPVDKIVGPGNAYVAAAKRRVFGRVGIDMIAGPSEILVVADENNDPDWIAVDLLSQAEHDTAAQSILITDSADFAQAAEEAVEARLKTAPRREIAGASWRDFGAVVTVKDLAQAPDLVNRLAPEHLELAVAEPEALAQQVRHAGAIFLGRYTPEAIGDYVAGANHVLPTARSARFASGLGVHDFLKRTSIVGCNPDSLAAIGGAAVTLAEAEGLDAHARSVSVRLNAPL